MQPRMPGRMTYPGSAESSAAENRNRRTKSTHRWTESSEEASSGRLCVAFGHD